RQASPPPARYRPGARSARREPHFNFLRQTNLEKESGRACCASYGPGHPLALAVPRCLRPLPGWLRHRTGGLAPPASDSTPDPRRGQPVAGALLRYLSAREPFPECGADPPPRIRTSLISVPTPPECSSAPLRLSGAVEARLATLPVEAPERVRRV